MPPIGKILRQRLTQLKSEREVTLYALLKFLASVFAFCNDERVKTGAIRSSTLDTDLTTLLLLVSASVCAWMEFAMLFSVHSNADQKRAQNIRCAYRSKSAVRLSFWLGVRFGSSRISLCSLTNDAVKVLRSAWFEGFGCAMSTVLVKEDLVHQRRWRGIVLECPVLPSYYKVEQQHEPNQAMYSSQQET